VRFNRRVLIDTRDVESFIERSKQRAV